MAIGKNSPYTDKMGRFRTLSLFVETFPNHLTGMKPMYSLKGKKGWPDLHDIYMDTDDPTEYAFAMECFESWAHFQHLTTLKWFQAYLFPWREELEVKMRSRAVRALMAVATTEGNKGTTAAKWVADKGWDKKRGRPSKEELVREQKVAMRIKGDVADDAKRLGLH